MMDDQELREAAAARPGYATYPQHRLPAQPAPDDLADLAQAAGVDQAAEELPEWERELLPRASELQLLRAERDALRADARRTARELTQVWASGDHARRQLMSLLSDRDLAGDAGRLDLIDIQLRAAAADPGPWHVEPAKHSGYPQWVKTRSRMQSDGRGWPVRVATDGALLVAETFTGPEHEPANAVFIAAARADVPALVAEVLALRRELRLARVRRLAWPVAAVGWLVALAGWAFLIAEVIRSVLR